ncbi:Putative mannose-6-phosphate receptor binding domain superfamily, MRH domain-containing protein [Colletotrichum destructivum]|uniref:Mannose-6-phosphate receptor binding domain superfamily, MRH domain-containing protein n=1 Tax=Colletotrichum destructivum TaxID=34406 RepID=A0AAX4I137_9PEZI|nr:Putative mannose-6-phosphate receptor binding domain superfamily, MRH domain-containing protein [Colletotrichum destructivum]
MHLPHSSTLLLLLAATIARAADTSTPSTTTSPPACTAASKSGTGAFYDLRPDIAVKTEEGKSSKGSVTTDYHARGWDYGRNFTLNICAPVLEALDDVEGLTKSEAKNVSAYYTYKGETYSIGSSSMDIQSRGRILVLQYKNGSPCDKSKSKSKRSKAHDGASYNKYSDDDETTASSSFGKSEKKVSAEKDDSDSTPRRKSATISFHCDTEQVGGAAHISFVGSDPDDCAYFFEARSQHACPRAEPHQPGSVGPGSVFAIIFVIAVLVYFGGGVFYQRTVAHARGWRQLPNYSLWAGIWSFVSDIFVIATSSCAQLLPGRRGYSHLSGSPSRRNREDENRLIDQLDEEWDD